MIQISLKEEYRKHVEDKYKVQVGPEYGSSLTHLLSPNNETKITVMPEDAGIYRLVCKVYASWWRVCMLNVKLFYLFSNEYSFLKFNFQVVSLNLSKKEAAATEMNEFIEQSTNGKIRNVVKPATIKVGFVWFRFFWFGRIFFRYLNCIDLPGHIILRMILFATCRENGW